jgi:predicted amidohydrolase YtcJ
MDGGLSLAQADLGSARSEAEAVELARAWAAANPAGAVRGRGWSYDIMPAGSYPTRAALDAVFATRPVVLESYDGHAYWFNTAALRQAGLGVDARDPEGARFVREADGRLSGTVLEAGGELVAALAGGMSRDEKAQGVRRGLALLAASGVTAADVMSGDLEEFEVLAALEARGELPVRVFYSPPLGGDLAGYRRLRERARGRLEFGWLKGFVDGAFESKTAQTLTPFPDGTRAAAWGTEPERLKAQVREAQAAGFAVALHAVGDGAVRAALDAYQAARDLPAPARRHRVEHGEVVDPDDLARFVSLDVVASMQPLHADPGGPAPAEGAWSRNVGPERLPRSFPWRALTAAGAVLAFGSDWPVVTQDPLTALAFAQARKDGALTFEEAVRGYTAGPAYAARREGELGCLDPGCLADVTAVAPGAPKPALVLVGGRRVP